MTLDQMNVAENAATQHEIEEALEYQRLYGGRLESHLFRLGYVSELKLVEMLSRQTGFAGICLSGTTIDENVISRLPAEFAGRWTVLPVAFDSVTSTLTVACEDPKTPGLAESLAEVCPGVTFDLRVALSDILRSRLASHYRRPVADSDEPDSADSQSTSEPADTTPSLNDDEVKPEVSGRCRVLLYEELEGRSSTVVQLLGHQGFSVSEVPSEDRLIPAIQQTFPQALILFLTDDRAALDLSARLSIKGMDLSARPTYLVLSKYDSSAAGKLMEAGFEDVLSSDNVLDLLMIKLSRLRERLNCERAQRLEIMQNLGTHGSLTDMNVIDLLQAMGPTAKTARISVSAHGQQLTVFLDRGRIVYAECDDIRGPEAVYCALAWRQGVWSVDPVPPEELPEPNNDLTNEAVLLDGCRRLDEMGRRNTVSEQPAADPLAALENLN
jgi:hypothetical protein